MKTCSGCGVEIPQVRLDALPHATTCVDCSTEQRVMGMTRWDGKHTPILEVVPPEKFQPGRSKMNADLGKSLGNYNNPFTVMANHHANQVRNLSLELKTKRVEAEPVNFVPARCHPDRPKVTLAGDCLECALELQRARVRR